MVALVKIGAGLSMVKSLKLRIIYINQSLCDQSSLDIPGFIEGYSQQQWIESLLMPMIL